MVCIMMSVIEAAGPKQGVTKSSKVSETALKIHLTEF